MGCCPWTKRREPRGFAPHPLPPEDTAPSVATVTKGVFLRHDNKKTRPERRAGGNVRRARRARSLSQREATARGERKRLKRGTLTRPSSFSFSFPPCMFVFYKKV